jgi:hypothetical protein
VHRGRAGSDIPSLAPYPSQALDTLIKCTEDFRDDLVVILAGYSEEMKRLSVCNPGVKSRFPTTIE